MFRRLVRTPITMLILAGTVVAGSGLPAQATVSPKVREMELILTYYNNAQHSIVVGTFASGCYYYASGYRTAYVSSNSYLCK